jgi:hypothetical protein
MTKEERSAYNKAYNEKNLVSPNKKPVFQNEIVLIDD